VAGGLRRGGTVGLAVSAAAALAVLVGIVIGGFYIATAGLSDHVVTSQPAAAAAASEHNPGIDPGTDLGGAPAPNFTLTDQFGRRISLAQYRGKAVLLAFVDSRCTTVCPLTSLEMLDAVRMLGPAAAHVQLVAIDANPDAHAVSDVRAYSAAHGMLSAWQFLTGSRRQLDAVWRAYHVYVAAVHNAIDHQPAVYVIDPRGRERELYLTQMVYSSVRQQADVLATAVAHYLPGRPEVAGLVSLRYRPGIGPAEPVRLPVVGGEGAGGSVVLGRGHPHVVVFFATWLTETSNLAGRLTALNRYARLAAARGLPGLVAVDAGSVETAPSPLPALLHRLHLAYPVVVDATGQLADGYGVQDQPWFDVVDRAGRVAVRHDGWWPAARLARAARSG
jgi:cytochrome oxidase Cu insertion factor (SCO1/SenC/PrrC family)